jgi:HTH-type transcriptional regulator, cell division transcriptional repressor
MPKRNIVGPGVREARLQHQPPLTQAELAARLRVQGLGLDRVAVSKIEIGYREVVDVVSLRAQ